MRLSIVNKVVTIFDHIANLFHHIKLTIFYCVVELQLNELSFTIERDKSNIFLVFFNTKTFSTSSLR